MAHTPGPWSVPHFATDNSCECQYVLSDTQTGMGAIATVHHSGEKGGHHNEPMATAKANAHLIAAAPDMLTALRRVYYEWDGEPEDMIHVQEAIAKATGIAGTAPGDFRYE